MTSKSTGGGEAVSSRRIYTGSHRYRSDDEALAALHAWLDAPVATFSRSWPTGREAVASLGIVPVASAYGIRYQIVPSDDGDVSAFTRDNPECWNTLIEEIRKGGQ